MSLILPARIAAKRRLAREVEARIAAEVAKAYPGHLFTITVDPEHGNVFIDHPLLASAKGRYFVNKNSGDTIKDVLRQCGEILERVNIPRGAAHGHMLEYDEASELAKTAYLSR